MERKKLLILGGSFYLLPLIEKAHELGVYVITADYLPDNAAHKYADEYHNVSVIDKEAVLNLAKELKIDGVTAFVNDIAATTAAYVAEKLGLNFQCPYESAVILQDKGKFRKFLSDNGFNSPHSKRYDDVNAPMNDIDYFDWPVIVKPTDSCGSRGVTKVEKPEDLPSAIKEAVDNCRNGAFIIEDFISFKGCHSSADSFTIDGKLVFNVFSDQLFDVNSENPYAPTQIIWPSTMEKKYQDELTSELQRLMTLLHMKHGIYNIETCVGSNGKPYIMEVSPRGGGCRIAQIQKMAYGIDLIENEIRQAVDMPINPIDKVECDGVWCEIVLHANEGQYGTFVRYEIDEKIKNKYVKMIDFQKKPGDKIEPFSGAGLSFGNMFVRCDDRQTLNKLLVDMPNWFKIITK